MQVAVTTAVPILTIPLAIRPWARFLDRHHVIVFRSVHSKVGAVASILLVLAVLLHLPLLLWPGALLLGISLAAGSLGWSAGPQRFRAAW